MGDVRFQSSREGGTQIFGEYICYIWCMNDWLQNERQCLIIFQFLPYLFFCFLEPSPGHMEVPTLEVKLDLQLPAYTTAIATQDPSCICDLHHSSLQRRIPNPLSEARG